MKKESNWSNEIPQTKAIEFDKTLLKEIFKNYAENKLPLNIAQLVLGDVQILEQKDSWVSSARRGEAALLKIGLEAVPRDTINRWGWGVYEAGDQVHIKASHEYAHFIQEFFDKDLASFLDNRMKEVKDRAHPYLELYAFLIQTGRISGLPEESIYQQQNETLKQQGSSLDMQTYEDLAEVMGAWMLGNDYFNFRLDNSRTALTDAQRIRLTELIESVFDTWALQKSKE